MNALIWKEIRLVLPAFIAAVLMIGAVMALQIIAGEGHTFGLLLFIGNLPVALLALTSFGREFSLGSFTFQMAQPVSRRILWRTKLTVLSIFLLALLVIGWGSVKALVPLYPGSGADFFTIPMLAALLLATATGALWSTLLLRQVIAAFWFALFLPWVLVMGAAIVELSETATTLALFAYAAAGFVFASRLFRKAEDANWTGGELDLPFGRGQTFGQRSKRPWRALFAKEIQSQQVTLIGIGALFLLHMIAVFLRKGAEPKGGMLATVLDLVPFVWVFVPLLAGGMSVAEERRMGTLEFYRTLPVGRGKQVLVKALTTLAIGGLLGSTLLIIAEKTAIAIGVAPNVGFIFSSDLIGVLVIVLLALSLIAFYASTVSRNVLQAFGISVLISPLLLALLVVGPKIGDLRDWWGPQVFHIVVWPMLFLAMMWLARANFSRGSTGWSLWKRQLLVFIAALCLAFISTAAIYHRTWEFVLPLEPAHGPARLSLADPAPPKVSFTSSFGILITITKYELRAQAFEPYFGELRGSTSVLKGEWVDANVANEELLAVRSDGTLWNSREPAKWAGMMGTYEISAFANVEQFGTESNWSRIIVATYHKALLSKRDGSLWQLGPQNSSRDDRKPLRNFDPVPLRGGQWARIVPSSYSSFYAWERSGKAYLIEYRSPRTAFGSFDFVEKKGLTELGSSWYARPVPSMDNLRLKQVVPAGLDVVGLLENGTVWLWRQGFRPQIPAAPGADWVSISAEYPDRMIGLKKDGSILVWGLRDFPTSRGTAERFSIHSDWIAIDACFPHTSAIAADGSVWLWTQWQDYHSYPRWLMRSRRPVRVSNVLEPR